MEQEPEVTKVSVKQERARKAIREVRRATRRKFSSEEKIRIVLERLRGEETISELCRREGIIDSMLYYK
jgi:transposase